MGIKALALYRSHQGCLNQEAVQMFQHDRFDRALSQLHCTRSAEESRVLNDLRGMALIIAGSGMCEGGRIVHHLKHNLWRPHVHVILVGFQVQGTLGAKLVGGARRIKIHGEPIAVNASIHTLGGFSAHAGQSGLIEWAGSYCHAPKAPRVILTHGEDRLRAALRDQLEARFGVRAECLKWGGVLTIQSP
jgi:metallo-beta-lactamase family protein